MCEGWFVFCFGFFFPSFSLSRYFLVALLRLSVNCPMLPPVAWDVAVHLVPVWGGQLTSDHVGYLPCSACLITVFMFSLVVNTGTFIRRLNAVLAPVTSSQVIFYEKYLSISKKYPFCQWSRGRVQQLGLSAGTSTVQAINWSWYNCPLFCQQSLSIWFLFSSWALHWFKITVLISYIRTDDTVHNSYWRLNSHLPLGAESMLKFLLVWHSPTWNSKGMVVWDNDGAN